MKITKGIQLNPAARVVIYGVEGIGKTTLASKLDRPLFVDFEAGTAGIEVGRLEEAPTTLAELYAIVEELRRDPNHAGFQTLVFDGADAIEALLKADILGPDPKYETIEQLYPYGKAGVVLAEKVGAFLDQLDLLVESGMDVCVVCHSACRTFTLPGQTDSFDRYELTVDKKSAPVYRAWADILLFVNYWTDVETNEKGKARAVGGKRYVYTTHHATYEGKHREPFPLPDKLPLDEAAEVLPKVIAAGVCRPTAPVEAAPRPAPEPAPAAVAEMAKTAPDLPNPDLQLGPNLSKVSELMWAYGIGVEELRAYIASRGVCPEPVWQFEEIPEAFAAWLIGGWNKAIAKKIIAARGNVNK